MTTNRHISVAVIGNPNVGKSTLFNDLTGSAQVIGNWCGKTTEACTIQIVYDSREISFTDLPGIYGFGHSSIHEITADKYLHNHEPDLPMVVIDAVNLERNLYLVIEVLERYERAIIILNRLDAADEHGMVIDHAKLSLLLGVPVIPVRAHNFSVNTIFRTLIEVNDGNIPLNPVRISYSPEIEAAVEESLKTLCQSRSGCKRWLAVEATEQQSEDFQTQIITTRYAEAAKIATECMIHNPTQTITDRIDNWALHRFFGVPIMIGVFACLFFLTFTVSKPISELIGNGVSFLGYLAAANLPVLGFPPLAVSLISDGLISGIGATLGFLPQIAIFFLVYNFIQDSGYIIRVAFLMDRVMSAIGLNGKIFIPLVAGYSCNVSGILASRILTSRYDRLVAVLASTFAPCSARLGVMVFMVSAFFPSSKATLIMLTLLAISVGMMALIAFLVRFFIPAAESSGFMTEVPIYQLPSLKSLLLNTADRTWHFLKRIRNVIIYSSFIMWFLSTFPQGAFDQTYLARIGKILEPFGLFMGLDWQLIVALIAAIPAKESALTALGVIYHTASDNASLAQVLTSKINPLAAFTFLVVYMTYIPCLATVITTYQEMRKWSIAILSVYGSIIMSLLLGLCAYNIGRLFIQ